MLAVIFDPVRSTERELNSIDCAPDMGVFTVIRPVTVTVLHHVYLEHDFERIDIQPPPRSRQRGTVYTRDMTALCCCFVV